MHPLLRQLYIAHLNNYRHVYICMSIHKRPILLKEEENQRNLAQFGHLTPCNALSIMSKRQLRGKNVLPCAFVYFPVRNSPFTEQKGHS